MSIVDGARRREIRACKEGTISNVWGGGRIDISEEEVFVVLDILIEISWIDRLINLLCFVPG